MKWGAVCWGKLVQMLMMKVVITNYIFVLLEGVVYELY